MIFICGNCWKNHKKPPKIRTLTNFAPHGIFIDPISGIEPGIEPTTYRSKVKRSLRDSRGFWTPRHGFQILGTVVLDFSLCQSLSLDSGFLSFVGSQSLGFRIPRAKFFGFFDQDSHALPTHHSPHHFVPGPRGPGTGTRLHGFL